MRAETTPTTDLAQAEARLPRWMIGLAVVTIAAGLVAAQVRFVAGFALGAALAILNYLWLHQAVETLMAAGEVRVPRRVIAKFMLRYPLAIAAVYLFYRTGWLPPGAILAGFFVPVAGVLLEALLQLREGARGANDN